MAPWQTEAWIADMRQQSATHIQFARMIENRFVDVDSDFIDMTFWDQCTDSRDWWRRCRSCGADLGWR